MKILSITTHYPNAEHPTFNIFAEAFSWDARARGQLRLFSSFLTNHEKPLAA